MNEQLTFLLRNLPNLLIGFPGHRPGGLLLSMGLAILAIGLAFLMGIVIGTGCASGKRPLRWACHLYVQIFRGLPLVLLLLLVHQSLGSRLALNFTPLTSALVALTLYSSAYQAEIVRAGLRTVPQPMVDAARLLGGNPFQLYRRIKLPYALRVMLPAFTGQAISLFKDTSVVIIIGVADLMTVARIALGSDVGNAPYWLAINGVVGLLYFSIAFSLSLFAQRWEDRHQSGDLVHSLINY